MHPCVPGVGAVTYGLSYDTLFRPPSAAPSLGGCALRDFRGTVERASLYPLH